MNRPTPFNLLFFNTLSPLLNVWVMYAAHNPFQIRPMSGRKNPLSIEVISCFNALPLQARPGLLFLFLPFLCPTTLSLTPARRSWFFLTTAPGFAHNWLIRLQRGGEPISLVSFSPTRLSKPHTGPYTGFSRFCSHSPYLSPTGKGWPVRELGCHGLVDSPTTGSHGSNRAGKPFSWCRFPTLAPKPHTGPHGADFGSHRLFLPPFLGGSPVSWRSR